MLKFGFSVSKKSSTRNQESTPILRSVGGTVKGKFKLNAKASELLMLEPGDNIMFLDNKEIVLNAIKNKDAELVAWAKDNNTSITQYPISYAIAAGYAKFDKKGEPVLVKEKITKDKPVAGLVQAYEGAKTATIGDGTGIGCTLTFSDGGRWADLRGNANDKQHCKWSISTIPMDVMVNNGFEDVPVIAFELTTSSLEDMSNSDDDDDEEDKVDVSNDTDTDTNTEE